MTRFPHRGIVFFRRWLRAGRLWLKARLSGVFVRIRGGPLEGWRFGLFTGTRFLRGTYGAEEGAVLRRVTPAGGVLFDVGAHVGYFTLLAARTVGPSGLVVAFEPLPVNLTYLRRHVLTNGLENVRVIPWAVGRAGGSRSFHSRSGTGRGRLGTSERGRKVRVCSLDELRQRGVLPRPDVIKMDIEGGEVEALDGASEVLANDRPVLLLSTHGGTAREACIERLDRLEYSMTGLPGGGMLGRPDPTWSGLRSNPDSS